MTEAVPLVCKERLADLRASLPAETVSSLMASCLSDLRARLPALCAAAAGSEGSALFAEVHALCGMTASYGLIGLERRFRTIGTLAQAGDLESAAYMTRDLIPLIAATEDAVAAALEFQLA